MQQSCCEKDFLEAVRVLSDRVTPITRQISWCSWVKLLICRKEMTTGKLLPLSMLAHNHLFGLDYIFEGNTPQRLYPNVPFGLLRVSILMWVFLLWCVDWPRLFGVLCRHRGDVDSWCRQDAKTWEGGAMARGRHCHISWHCCTSTWLRFHQPASCSQH